MFYKVHFDIEAFEFWGGAVPVLETVKENGRLKELESLIEEMFDVDDTTDTEINDFVWFGALEALGLYDED